MSVDMLRPNAADIQGGLDVAAAATADCGGEKAGNWGEVDGGSIVNTFFVALPNSTARAWNKISIKKNYKFRVN